MTQTLLFWEVIEAVESLSIPEQEALVGIFKRRLIDAGRERITAEIEESRREFAEGKGGVMTPQQMMDEVLS